MVKIILGTVFLLLSNMIVLLILIILLLFFGVSPAFAVTVTTSSVPSTITNESFTFNISISGASSGTNYLRVDLYKNTTGTPNYFGETYNGTSWYGGSTGTQYFPISIVSGQTWNGSIQGKLGNPSTTEYPGLGSYKLRVRRYTSSGNAASDTQIPADITINYTASTSSPSPSPTTSPNPSPSSTTSSSAFTISNIPSQIDSTETFNASVNLSLSDKANTTFYLKGAFKRKDNTNYFGLTKINGSWIKNNKTYSDQYKITTSSSGNWSGNLEIQPDIMDSGYEGAGEYIFKVGRYTEDGSLSWSNEVTIKINAQEIVLDDDSDILGVDKTQDKQDKTKSSKRTVEEYSLEKYIKVATPASRATPSAKSKAEVKAAKQINFISIIGSILVIIGVIPISYAIYNKFRKRNKSSS